MNLLEMDVVDNLLHSSSVSKGIERTMEHIINELDSSCIYILRSEGADVEVLYEWEREDRYKDFSEYIKQLDILDHFYENDLFVSCDIHTLSKEEQELYRLYGYESIVEYQLRKHGNVIGYIVIGWEQATSIDDEDLDALHLLLKLMNERILKQLKRDIMGESDWDMFDLTSEMTGTMLYMVDDDYKVQYINRYAKQLYPEMKVGEYCYKMIAGEKTPCKDCPVKNLEVNEAVRAHKFFPYLEDTFFVNTTKVVTNENRTAYVMAMQKGLAPEKNQQRVSTGRKFIFSLASIYKDILCVEIRKDSFYNLLSQNIDNKHSYSMDFVLKWLSKVHLDDKQKFLECFDINFLQNDFVKGVAQKEIDFRYRTHEGSYHCMNGQVLFDRNASKEASVFILFQDVEQLRSQKIEEQRQMRDSLLAARSSAELKGQLLSSISHEIRTPMNGIVSMTSVAKQVYQQEERLLDCLSNIEDYADRMMRVMDSLLETVQVDSDSIVIAKRPFRLEYFLNRIDMAFREEIEKKNMNFVIDSACNYQVVMGDEIRLYQAINALLKNVISYTPISGTIRLTAKQVAADAQRVFIRFYLDDNGNGMNDTIKSSIFGFGNDAEVGYVDESHFELTLAAKIIRLMGGDVGINVDSSGTHLSFTIPFSLPEEEREKTTKKKVTAIAGKFAGKRILYADDSELGRDAIRAVLEIAGFTVDTVENGRKAVINFISQPAYTYDAVIMDVHMPYMDGREATKTIRISGKEDGETIPIIGVMANTYDQDVEQSIAAGMQAHLAKPVDVETLYRVLRKHIKVEE